MLRAQIAEWEDDAAARKQYEKDCHSLVHGRNAERFSELKDLQQRGHYDKLEEQMGEWRRKKLISVDDEATMRVALAKDEEKRAQKALVFTTQELTFTKGLLTEVGTAKKTYNEYDGG